MYLEQDESMPAFIRDLKAYSEKQYEYHSQHSAAIRDLKAQNKFLMDKIDMIQTQIEHIKYNSNY